MAQQKVPELLPHMIPQVSDINNVQVDGQCVLVKPADDYALKTKGGVWLPEETAVIKRALTLANGEIVGIGEDVIKHTVGQVVYFMWDEKTGQIRHGDDIYIMINEYSIRCHIKDKSKEVDLKPSADLKVLGTHGIITAIA